MNGLLILAFLVTLDLTAQPAPGWRLRPAGRQIALDSLPMSSAVSKDGKYVVVLSGGYEPPSLTVLRTDRMEAVGKTPLADAWLGLAFSPDGKFLYVGGGSQAAVYELAFNDGKLKPARTFAIVPEASRKPEDFIGDVALSPDGRLIYAAGLFRDAIHVINPQSGRVIEKWPTGRRPYRILFHPDGQSYFVSSWADGSVYHHEAISGKRLAVVRLGQHPTDMVWRARKAEEKDEEQIRWTGRLFVAAANTNSVYAVGVSESKELRMLEAINVSMTPRQPLGMTPSGLGLSPDQSRLFVACSDANAVAVADIGDVRTAVLGFVPTGSYPTSVRMLPDGKLLVLNGKGSASSIEPFDDSALEQHTETVLGNSPYRDDLLDRVDTGRGSPVPSRPGEPTPIEHVIYIVTAGGDPAGSHRQRIAKEFVRFENFQLGSDGSAEVYNRATAAISPDYVQRLWPNSRAGRRNKYDYEGGEAAALPPAGRIWSNAVSAGITVRNYGWFVNNGPRAAVGSRQVASVLDPSLAKITNLNYRGPDPGYPDEDRAAVFVSELNEFEKSGGMPKLLLVRLGNGDQPLGTVIEAVSKSRFWATTAIFILDAERPQAYVVSPYARRGNVDRTAYGPASMLRTIELLVGLRPMTHFDAAAHPMSEAFATTPDTRPYAAATAR